MFVSLRLGLFVRVLVAVAVAAAVLMLVFSGGVRPRAVESGTPHPTPESTRHGTEVTDVRYRVSGTGGAGLVVRDCPDVDCTRLGRLDEGDTFVARCWQSGSTVAGNTMWVAGSFDSAQGFVSSRYLYPEAEPAAACEGGGSAVAQ